MSTDSIDRRVRKTRRQLRECLISLLKEKKVQDITVRELTDMADLNRGTFYLHYKDVFDLLEKTEAEPVSYTHLSVIHQVGHQKGKLAALFGYIRQHGLSAGQKLHQGPHVHRNLGSTHQRYIVLFNDRHYC